MPASPIREIAARAFGLVRNPWLLVWSTVLVGGGAAFTRLPLLETPGYELSLAMSILVSVCGGAIGILAGRQERNLVVGTGPRPPGATRTETPLGAAAVAAATAFALNALFLFPALLAAVVHSAVSSRCDPFRGLPFYLALPVPSAALGAALGSACGLASSKRRWSALLYVFFVLVSAAATLAPVLQGPQAFAFNHFASYFPGPIYDETLSVTTAVVAYRLATVVWAIAAIATIGTLLDFKTGVVARPTLLRPGSLTLLVACAAVLVTIDRSAFRLGIRTSPEDLDGALGGRRVTKHLVIHYPAGKPRQDVDRLERDLEFRYSQLARFFGVEPPGKVSAYVYRDGVEKLRLVGARDPDFAKPWRLEIHVNDEPFPHRNIRHELAHVFCAAFGGPLLKISGWGNAGIIEGVAVAADDPADELTLHEWARAMRELKLAPDVRAIVGSWGFYTESANRAYTIAGSFFRYLADTYGAARLRAVYPRGDFPAAYGKDLNALSGEWEAFVDKVPIDEGARRLAQVRFEQPSMFARPCAREIAALSEQAFRLIRSDPDEAVTLFRRCQEIAPKVTQYQRGIADAYWAKRDLPAAASALESLAAQADLSPAAKAETWMALGDIAWERGQTLTAKKDYEDVLALHRDRSTDRTVLAKLATLDDPTLGPAVFSLLLHGPSSGRLLRLRELVDQKPDWGLGWYLVGRNLGADHRHALPYLERASQDALPSLDFEVEDLRLLALARYFTGSCSGMEQAFEGLAKKASTRALEQTAGDWRERCAFEKAQYGGLLVEEE